jgi:SAM-dependent methyltransferase
VSELRRAAKRAARLIRHPGRILPAIRRRLRQAPPSRFALITGPIDLGGLGLEIGPSWRPLLAKANGYNVRVADHLDQAGLIATYDGVRPTKAIEPVDYVLTGPRLTDIIDARFDWIVGSHVLEHTVCLITFLREAEALLRPGGVLSLAVPDRRYCFDRFRERTSLGRVIDVFHADRVVHSEGSVLELHLNGVAKGGSISWDAAQLGAFRALHTLEKGREQAALAATGQYVDVHNWVFTPNHLRLLLVDLQTLGFIGLREVAYHETVGSEFYLALSRDGHGPGLPRDALLRLSALELHSTETIVFET